jgi:hypothetical protein
MHPYRMRYELFSDMNPFLKGISVLADQVREQRKPASPDNPFLKMQEAASDRIVAALDQYQLFRDQAVEQFFLSTYGQPLLQTLVGLRADSANIRRRIGRDIARESVVVARRTEAAKRLASGGEREAVIRSILYIARSPEMRVADERAFGVLRELRTHLPAKERVSLARFKEVVQEQNMILQLDEERAMSALPKLLTEVDDRQRALEGIRKIMTASGELSGEAARRMSRVAELFNG